MARPDECVSSAICPVPRELRSAEGSGACLDAKRGVRGEGGEGGGWSTDYEYTDPFFMSLLRWF